MSVYLDNNATTPIRPEVKAAMVAALDHYGNASSIHSHGREARRMVDDARRSVASLFNVRPEQVVFTSGGTEANNTAVIGAAYAFDKGHIILTSPTEHSSVYEPVLALTEHNVLSDAIGVDSNGVVDLEHLECMLKRGNVGLVSVMYANNETGVIQPVHSIARLCARYGAVCHTDAVQATGKVPIDFTALDVDIMSLSFHKFGGPKGVGALIMKPDVDMRAFMYGGAQERNRRAGTENVPGIVGAGMAAQLAGKSFEDMARLETWRNKLETGLKGMAEEVFIVGETVPRLPNTTNVVFPGVEAESSVMALDMAGFAVTQGSACSSGRSEASRVLLALGFNEHEASCGLRISLGWANREEDIDAFLAAYGDIARRMSLLAGVA